MKSATSTKAVRLASTATAMAILSATGVALAGSASAAGCTVTDYVKDGHNLTAAYVAGSGTTFTGALDATGCEIGIYFGSVSSGTVDDVTLTGHPTYYGVLVNGAMADVTDSTINDVGETPSNGAQHGVAVAYVNGANGSVTGNDIERYQKGGIAVDNSSAVVDGNTVVGLGQVSFIAQNGVQFSNGATGSVTANDIKDNYYTGCSNKDAAKTGCVPYVSTGLLLYGIDPSLVKASKNHFRGDQRNQYMIPASSL